jgi:hypothetical protein
VIGKVLLSLDARVSERCCAAAALDFAVLVVGGHIFGGLSHLDVSAVGHLTALVTATAAVTLTVAQRGRATPEAVPEPGS